MKKTLSIALVAIIAVFSVLPAWAQNNGTLPKNATDFIAKHFNGYEINFFEKDRDVLDVDYTVYVGNGKHSYKLEFDKKGNVKDIESESRGVALPQSVLPASVVQYVKGAFPNAKVTEWSKDGNKQLVELNNDMELLFNSKGKFLRIDD
ncbi:MAG: PepSY-like domain-containing protein [Bacteroidaceae bacterium]|nr:PepSY-like domain-containing protein [Bacteroidaceae bacterium]